MPRGHNRSIAGVLRALGVQQGYETGALSDEVAGVFNLQDLSYLQAPVTQAQALGIVPVPANGAAETSGVDIRASDSWGFVVLVLTGSDLAAFTMRMMISPTRLLPNNRLVVTPDFAYDPDGLASTHIEAETASLTGVGTGMLTGTFRPAPPLYVPSGHHLVVVSNALNDAWTCSFQLAFLDPDLTRIWTP